MTRNVGYEQSEATRVLNTPDLQFHRIAQVRGIQKSMMLADLDDHARTLPRFHFRKRLLQTRLACNNR